MSFQLVIAEKPSVARSIAAVIGAAEKQTGYWQGGGYLVSWCIGHLVSFAEAGQYDEKYCKWRYEDLPILPQPWQFVVPDEKKQQFEVLRALLNRPDVDSVTAATDAGREGELIFRFVYQMAGCTKPVKRLWISSMEDAAIREGFANLRPDSDYDALYQSALCRAKADWLVGINATRLFSVLYHKTLTVGRVLNSKKVSDHHAILPTAEFVKQGFTGLAESECKLMNLVCSKLLCAIAAPHEYETVTAVFSCAGNEFAAKGKTVLVPGWKEIDQRFRSTLKADGEEETENLNTLPELTEGQSYSVVSDISEHFTSPPKAYTEDTLLSAMERAGAEDMPEDKVNCSAGAREGGLGQAERKGLGTPATRAAILEKLVQMGFVQRKGKRLVPTKDGINLAVVLPESLTSPALTAEWENRLTEIAKGNADADEFMAEIEAQVRQLVKTYSCISADKQNLFQSERVIIGKCPRCGENVYEGKKNFYCGNRSCQFVMWKNDRFFEQRKKAFTPKIAAALLKNGKAKVKGLYSEKTGKTYDATVLLVDTGGKYVNYRVERKE